MGCVSEGEEGCSGAFVMLEKKELGTFFGHGSYPDYDPNDLGLGVLPGMKRKTNLYNI
jgi:hypothetical protein